MRAAVKYLLGLMIAAGVMLGVAQPAMAEPGLYYLYHIDPVGACALQGHTGASLYNPWSPYSWYCYDIEWGIDDESQITTYFTQNLDMG